MIDCGGLRGKDLKPPCSLGFVVHQIGHHSDHIRDIWLVARTYDTTIRDALHGVDAQQGLVDVDSCFESE